MFQQLIADSGNRLAAIVSIAGLSLPLQFKQIRGGMPISAISQQRAPFAAKNQELVSSREYWKTLSHNMNGLSAISYL
jgi:hypothetical protein